MALNIWFRVIAVSNLMKMVGEGIRRLLEESKIYGLDDERSCLRQAPFAFVRAASG